MTQEGIAAAAWVELRHLSQYLRPLIAEELVRERVGHVKGIRQRRKVYDLTEAGQHAAFRLRDRVRAETVPVQDAAGSREETVAKILETTDGKVPLLEIVRRATQLGRLEVNALLEGAPSGFVEALDEAPHLEHFVGREAELARITADAPGPRIFVIRGVAGIGKSSVAARACELLRGKRNLFWHTLRPWDTRISVLTALGGFLSTLGKPGLRSVVARGDSGQASEVLREDLPGAHCLLVFDDAQDATSEVVAFFRYLKDAIAAAPDVWALVLTRRSVPFYDRRDVSLRHLIQEIDLGGLSREDIAAFLSPDLDPAAGALVRSLGGHPLLLQLVRAVPRAPAHEGALRDMRRFLEEEVYGELTEPERAMLKTASLYRVPVPATALESDAAVTHDTLLSLTNRALLVSVGADAVEVHDTVRAFFSSIVSRSEQSALRGFVARQLQSLATHSRASGDLVACIGFLSNALDVTAVPPEREGLLEALADIHEKIGDLPSAVTEYKEAERTTDAPEVQARLHRKAASAFETRGELGPATEELAASRRALGETASPERGWIDLVACRLAAQKEEFEEARSMGRVALDSFRSQGDPQGLVRVYYTLGNLELDDPNGDPAASEKHFLAGLDLARDLRDPEREVRLRIGLAHLYADRLGDLDRTMQQFAAIEALPEGLRDPQTLRSFLMLQSWIHLEIRADYPAAERYFNETAALARKIHFVSSLPVARYGLALSAYYQGRVREAREELGGFARESESLGFPAWAVEAKWVVVECDLRLGDMEGFRASVRDIARPALAVGRRARPVRVKILEGVDLAVRNDLDGARSAFDAALRLARKGQETEQALELHLVHLYAGVALQARGYPEEGSEHLRQARSYLERGHLNARLSILSDVERDLAETFARTPALPRA